MVGDQRRAASGFGQYPTGCSAKTPSSLHRGKHLVEPCLAEIQAEHCVEAFQIGQFSRGHRLSYPSPHRLDRLVASLGHQGPMQLGRRHLGFGESAPHRVLVTLDDQAGGNQVGATESESLLEGFEQSEAAGGSAHEKDAAGIEVLRIPVDDFRSLSDLYWSASLQEHSTLIGQHLYGRHLGCPVASLALSGHRFGGSLFIQSQWLEFGQ